MPNMGVATHGTLDASRTSFMGLHMCSQSCKDSRSRIRRCIFGCLDNGASGSTLYSNTLETTLRTKSIYTGTAPLPISALAQVLAWRLPSNCLLLTGSVPVSEVAALWGVICRCRATRGSRVGELISRPELMIPWIFMKAAVARARRA